MRLRDEMPHIAQVPAATPEFGRGGCAQIAIAKAFAPDQRRGALVIGAADGELEIGAGKAAGKAAVLQHVAPLF